MHLTSHVHCSVGAETQKKPDVNAKQCKKQQPCLELCNKCWDPKTHRDSDLIRWKVPGSAFTSPHMSEALMFKASVLITITPCAYVKAVCGCCQRAHVAAGPRCSRRARPLAQGKQGPHRRAHKHARECERRITEREKMENPQRDCLRNERALLRQHGSTNVSTQTSTSLKFAWVIKTALFILLGLSGGSSGAIPAAASTYRASERGECSRRWRSPRLCVFRLYFSSPSCYCRRALASRLCHGSMLAFLFPASRDGIAAQVGGTGPFPRLWLDQRRGGSPKKERADWLPLNKFWLPCVVRGEAVLF